MLNLNGLSRNFLMRDVIKFEKFQVSCSALKGFESMILQMLQRGQFKISVNLSSLRIQYIK